jgi:hypothetical protein
MTRAVALLGIVASLALVAACGGTSPEPEPSEALPAGEPSAAGVPAAQPPAASEPPATAAEPPVEAEAPLLRQGFDGTCFPDVEAEPCTAGVPVGSHWTFEIYTHCGVEWIYLDGRFWLTEPLGELNAPPGWGNPIDEGVVTLEASDRALYLSQGGDEVAFEPAPADFEPPLCQ